MYEIFEELLAKKHVKANQVSKETGIPQSTFSDWKKGKSIPKQEKKDRISNFFKVDKNIFSNHKKDYCLECGNQLSMMGEKSNYHELEHGKWEKAVNKFGFCWPRSVSENAKAIARTDLQKGTLDFNERVSANTDIFKALFSRSLESSGYNLNHVDFNTYSAMLLYQEQFKQKIDKDVYAELVIKYGTSKGIDEGETYYHIVQDKKPHNVAAHKDDNENWTPEELKRIDEYKNLLIAARNNNKKA